MRKYTRTMIQFFDCRSEFLDFYIDRSLLDAFSFIVSSRLDITVIWSIDRFTNEPKTRLLRYYTLVHVRTLAAILRGIRNLM